MKKIRDLIYDYNDVFVAMIIVAVAAFVIFWRINTVMAYSDYLAANKVDKPGIDVNFDDVDLTPDEVDDIETPGEDPTGEGGNTENPADNPEENQTTQPPVEQPVEDPKPQVPEVKSYTLEVKSGDAWGKVGSRLEEAGMIESSKAFVSRVVARKLDGNLRVGKFEVNSGMTLDEVIDAITKK